MGLQTAALVAVTACLSFMCGYWFAGGASPHSERRLADYFSAADQWSDEVDSRVPQPSRRTCPLENFLGLSVHHAKLVRAATDAAAKLPSEAQAFAPLRMHPGSKSLLQDAFVRFHHLLFQHSPPLLPLHEWGARGINRSQHHMLPGWTRAATELGWTRPTGHVRPSVLSRLAHNGWILGQAGRVTKSKAVCLGWDNSEYVDLFPSCVSGERWAFKFEPRARLRALDTKRFQVRGGVFIALRDSISSIAAHVVQH